MKKSYALASLLAVFALVLAACGSATPQADNLLDAIKQRGYILVSTDPNYMPQSGLNTDGTTQLLERAHIRIMLSLGNFHIHGGAVDVGDFTLIEPWADIAGNGKYH